MAFIEIYHNNPSLKTLKEFADENGVVLDGSFSLNDLLNYEGNSSRIQAAYFANPSQAASVDRLEAPVLIRVPQDKIQKEYVVAAGNIVVPNRDI